MSRSLHASDGRDEYDEQIASVERRIRRLLNRQQVPVDIGICALAEMLLAACIAMRIEHCESEARDQATVRVIRAIIRELTTVVRAKRGFYTVADLDQTAERVVQ